MTHAGPSLEILLRRLAETPQDFLDAPRTGKSGQLHVSALIFDLSHQIGQPFTEAELRTLSGTDANGMTLCAIACWLLSDDTLQGRISKPRLLPFLGQTLQALAAEYKAERYLLDPERREELVRITLADLGLLPAGETAAQAQDRLQALSSTERRRIIAAAREAEKRAREIREALIKKAAAEAADKYTRE
ncbi:hypothetical protein [Uliginosibacterium gangwonense]|uniref:hypothetical protein n=1 Tax=Uliginosibacterium gangwonense TaxID=392736 RepID=UPI000371AC7D|nr:hypothetical protein [Uliginosibacterium gangwonense]